MKIKKLLLVLIGLVIYFVPSLIFYHIYHSPAAVMGWFFFGWFPALVIIGYVE